MTMNRPAASYERAVREGVRAGLADAQIAARLGLTRQRVCQLRNLFGIPPLKRTYRPTGPRWPKTEIVSLPPIDPVRARRITESKKYYWAALERGDRVA